MMKILSWKLVVALAIVLTTLGGLDGVYGAGSPLVPTETFLQFDGVNDRLNIPDSDPLDLTSGELTVSAYINPSSWGNNSQGRIADHGGGSSGSTSGWSFHLENKSSKGFPQTLRFLINNDSSYNALADSNIISLNSWQHVAATLKNGTLTFYVDGALAGTRTGVPTPVASSEIVRIGMRATDSNREFDGGIDDVQFWDKALTQPEIQALLGQELIGTELGLVGYYPMNEGSGQTVADFSSNVNNATLGSLPDPDTADPTWTTMIIPLVSSIDIQKLPPAQTVISGSAASFDILVTNDGEVDLTNVVVSDPTAPDCDFVIGVLLVGETLSYSCALTNVTVSFTNTIFVTADDPDNNQVADSDTADVAVAAASIDILKTPNTQTVVSGGTASFTIDVTNDGNFDLTNVVVSDPQAPNCDLVIGAMVVGATSSHVCTLENVTVGLTNTAFVTADDPDNNQVADSDTAEVLIANPSIAIEKTPDLQQIISGRTATFTIDVTNDGDFDLINVAVADLLAPNCDNAIGPLAIGETVSYTCTLANVTAEFTNTATVTGDDPDNNQVTDSDTAGVVVVVAPPSVPTETFLQFDGTNDRLDIADSDALDLTTGELTVAGYINPAGWGQNSQGRIADHGGGSSGSTGWSLHLENKASRGFPQTFKFIINNDSSYNSLADVNAISLNTWQHVAVTLKNGTLSFYVDGQPAGVSTGVPTPAASSAIVSLGMRATDSKRDFQGGIDDIQFWNRALTQPEIEALLGQELIGTELGLVGYYPMNEGTGQATLDFSNNANNGILGTSIDPDTADPTWTTRVVPLASSIQIQKTPNTQTIFTGGNATFTIDVTNNGELDLVNVAVSDPLTPDCDRIIGALAAGASFPSYTCTLVNVPVSFTNTAIATGDDPSNNQVTDSDTADVVAVVPVASIAILKTPNTQTVVSGGIASFTIDVTNDGDLDLTNVTVSDPLSPNCDLVIGALAVGASSSHTCTLANVTADFTNTATATGDDPSNNQVTATDTADVVVATASITIEKTPDTQTILTGGTATFTIDVTNDGDFDLTSVTVSDPLAPDCDSVIGTLVAGATSSYTCTLIGVLADFTNTATVTGDDPDFNQVTASDTADVVVVAPVASIDIQKTPNTQTVITGGTAFFTILVTNDGDFDLTNVTVTDTLAPDCDNLIGTLVAGASSTYTCTLTNVTVGFINTASVTGDDPSNNAVTNSDIANVIVDSGPTSAPTETSLLFDGIDDRLDIPDSDDLDLTTGELTIAGYINPSGWGQNAQGRIADHGGGSSGSTSGWSLLLENKASRGFPQTLKFLINNDSSYNSLADVNAITLNTWQHVAVTLLNGTLTFYVEGVVVGVRTGVPTPAASDSIVRIGMRATDSNREFAGGIDDVQFWNRALTQPEIQALLGQELFGTELGLVGYFPLNEGTGQTASDFSSNANNATLGLTSAPDSADPAWQFSGPPSQAPVLDAIAGVSVGLGASESVNLNAIDPTVGDVITLSSLNLPAFAALVDNGDGTGVININPLLGDDGLYSVTVRATDLLGEFDEKTFNIDVFVPSPAIDIEKTPGTQNIVGGNSAIFTITVTNIGDLDLINVEVVDPLTPACDNLIGALAIGQVFSYVCTLPNVLADFTNTASVTGTAPLGDVVTDTSSAIVRVVETTAPTLSYLEFDGENNFVDVPDSDEFDLTSGAFTLAAYIRPTGWGGGDKGHIIDHEGSDHNSPGDIGWSLHIDNSAFQGRPETIRMQINQDASFNGLAAQGAITLDVWQYVVATYDAGTLTFYVNGDVVGTSTGVPIPLPSATDVRIGQWQSVVDRTFDGDIDDVQIWNRALSQTEVQQNMGVELTGTEPGLLLYHNYNEGAGQTAADITGNGNNGVLGLLPTPDLADPTWVTTFVASLNIQKTLDTPTVVFGGDATFTIDVVNDGVLDLANVTVSDPLAPACDNVIGALVVGASVSYTCTLSGVTSNFTNVATVTGNDIDGNVITDVNTADVVLGDSCDLVTSGLIGCWLFNEGTGSTTADSEPVNPDDGTLGDGVDAGPTWVQGSTVEVGDFALDFDGVDDIVRLLGSEAGDLDISGNQMAISAKVFIHASPDGDGQSSGSRIVSKGAGYEVLYRNNGGSEINTLRSRVTSSALISPNNVFNQDEWNHLVVTTDGVTERIYVNGAEVNSRSNTDPIATSASILTFGSLDPAEANKMFRGTLDDVLIFDRGLTPAEAVLLANLPGPAAAISIRKTPDLQTIVSGGTANFTIDVTNNGDFDLTNVAVTDPLAPDCDIVIGPLAIGFTANYTCSLANVTAGFTNTAFVTGDDPDNNQVSNSDTADVVLAVASIDIQKTPDTQNLISGATATFTIDVTNNGGLDLTGVTVTDALAPACDNVIGALAAGATISYNCTLVNVTAGFTNTASVTGNDPGNNAVTASDTADVAVVAAVASIDIQKTPNIQTVISGGTATFSILVTNNGNLDLTNVTVVDLLVPDCDRVIGALAAGATFASYDCSLANVTSGFTNTAIVTADDPSNNQVTDSDTGNVLVGDDCDLITSGLIGCWLFNEGTGSTTADSAPFNPDNGTLGDGVDAGPTWVAGSTGSPGDFALDFDGVNDIVRLLGSDNGDLDIVGNQISITAKVFILASPDGNGQSSGSRIVSKGSTGYELLYRNNGGSEINTLRSKMTSSTLISPNSVFNQNAWNHVAVTYDGVTETIYVNGVFVASQPITANVATSTSIVTFGSLDPSELNKMFRGSLDDVLIYNRGLSLTEVEILAGTAGPVASISIQKTPDVQTVINGGTATFTVNVFNSGAFDLTNVAVVDPIVPNCDNAIGALAVGATVTYNCSLANVTAGFTNTTTATGDDPDNVQVSNSDSSVVNIASPSIAILKTPVTQTVVLGGTATFAIDVTNDGDFDLTNVAVSDLLAPNCDSAIGALAVGETVSYNCTLANVLADFTNTATATGDDPINNQVSDSDTAVVNVLVPSITIQKAPDAQAIVSGGTATFTIDVANDGEVDLINVTVADPLASDCDNLIGALAVGETFSYTCTLTNVTANLTNTASVTAEDINSNQVTDSDTANVVIGDACDLITSGLIGCWLFDEGTGTTAADSALTNPDDGTLGDGVDAGPAWVTGSSGFAGDFALDFDGVDDTVRLVGSENGDLNIVGDQITIAAKVFIYNTPEGDGQSNGSRIISKGIAYELLYRNNGGTELNTVRSHIFSPRLITDDNVFTQNAWNHVAVTYDGATETIYVNGVPVEFRSITGNLTSSATIVTFGAPEPSEADKMFRGSLDDVLIFDRGLSEAEIIVLANTP